MNNAEYNYKIQQNRMPNLVLGADLAVLDDAEAGSDGAKDEDEPEEDAGAEGGVVELGRVLGRKREAERRADKIKF